MHHIIALALTLSLGTSNRPREYIRSWKSGMHLFIMKIQNWISGSAHHRPKCPQDHAHTCSYKTGIVKTAPKVDATVNSHIEEVRWCSGKIKFLSCDLHDFQRACQDIGALQSVNGKREAFSYSKQYNIQYKLTPWLTKFKFGDGVFSSLDTMQIRILTPNYSSFKSMRISYSQTFSYYAISISWHWKTHSQ